MKKPISAFVFTLLLCLIVPLAALGGGEKADITVTETKATSSSVAFKWKKVRSADFYRVLCLENGKYKAVLQTTEPAGTVQGLKSNKSYTFKVRAYRKSGGKNEIISLCREIRVRTKIRAVTLKAKAVRGNSVCAAWTAAPGAAEYRVAVRTSPGEKYKTVLTTEKTSFIANGMKNGQYIRIRVQAVNKKNTGEYSYITLYSAPDKVSGLKAKSVDYNSVSLSWDKVKNATGYIVYASRKKDSGYSKKAEVESAKAKISLKNASTKYYIKVRAVIETESQRAPSEPSRALSVTTKAYPFKISGASGTFRKGEYKYLSVPHYKGVKFKSSNSSVISVSGNRLFAAGTGTATVTASAAGKSQSVRLSVSSPVTSYTSCVYDYTNGRWVFSNGLNKRVYPASITKLVCALVALKYMSLDDVIVVGSELNMVESMSSRCGISRGEKFRLGDLLYGLLLPSGGDAAYTIAVNCARKVSKNPSMGYVDAKNYFVRLMNSYIKNIGGTGSNFVNPHGYPVSGHYTTPHDLVLVAKKVLANSTLRKITSTSSKYVTALTGKGRTWRTTNSLISSSSGFYSPYAHGLKTGTVNNGYTAVLSAATKNGRTIITLVIGCESFNARYQATHRLYNYYLW